MGLNRNATTPTPTPTPTPTTKSITSLIKPLSSYLYCLWLVLLTYSFSCFGGFGCLMANAEYYSSVDSLGKLGNMEASLVESFRNHLKEQQNDIDIVHRFIKNIKFHHELASLDMSDYIGNPINAFTLIKRLANDWKELNEFLKFNEIQNELKQLLTQFQEKDNIQLPDEYELKGAIRGLGRLQSIYNINADEMANGHKHGSYPLNWRDCLEIGATLLDEKRFQLSIDWLELSLKKLKANTQETQAIKDTYYGHIKEYLALAYEHIGELEKALNYLDVVLEAEPESSVRFTEKLLLTGDHIVNHEKIPEKSEYIRNFERLCRGESQKKYQPMTCQLVSETHPYFLLAPLKVEPISLDPPITLYHSLLNDAQISGLLNETENRMVRSEVVQYNTTEVNDVRVSQQDWLSPDESKVTNMMYKLFGSITGLDTNNTEIMQVAIYGIGGQYEPHHDFFGLSDVEAGGYTVFTELDIYLKPVKGAMVMWYNLFKSLDGDGRTLHAGCPVLRGSKRIANIWTHSGNQEFRRPCDLENDSKIKNEGMCQAYNYNC
ncbi:hypothetical protein DOY81_006467 [Sarcophaga bullata]|nr:hypothetical protein DOY81_006467 [Sarcophaga bullata]